MTAGVGSKPLLEGDGIGKSFGGKVVLRNAGFAIYHASITALMGRNGTGKTTLLKILAGVIRADYGTVRYGGEYLAHPSLPVLARNGLMFCSQGSVLVPHIPVRAHFDLLSRRYGAARPLEDVCDALRLGDLLDHAPRTLSGGELRRTELALALLRAPDCLIVDEPFAGVAPVDLPLISGALRTLRDSGTGVAISGHAVHDIMDVSDLVVWAVGGTTHWLGAPAEARRNFQFQQGYLSPHEGTPRPSPEREHM